MGDQECVECGDHAPIGEHWVDGFCSLAHKASHAGEKLYCTKCGEPIDVPYHWQVQRELCGGEVVTHVYHFGCESNDDEDIAVRVEFCSQCHTYIDADRDGIYVSRSGDMWCEGCKESGVDYASTLVAIEPQTEDIDSEPYSYITTTKFDEDFTYWVTSGDGDYADWEEDEPLPTPIKNQTYVHTGGYSGHVEFELDDGYEAISGGWVTGYPDETVKRKYEIGEFYEAMRSGVIVPPVPLWWVFGTTSNIFSTACDVVCRKVDRATIDAWLTTHGADLEEWLG